MIDTHTHLGQIQYDNPGLRPYQLLRWMDRHGIEKAIVMAIENPEEVDHFVTTREILRLTKPHRDRLFPLCAVDPRHRYPGRFNPRPIIESYLEAGCVGYGENLCGLPVDDPMQQIVYAILDELKQPLVMHFDHWINRDKPGLPGFEMMLATYKNVRFIGHSPHFWREISAEIPQDEAYPIGPVKPGGRLDELLARYPNLYADLSAHSGYNAISRDPEFGLAFLQRWPDRLMFATDYLRVKQETPLITYLRQLDLPKETFQRITHTNAEQVFGLPVI